MSPISVVIITKNEAHIIGKTLQAVATFSSDIIIVDSGSTDLTSTIARQMGARVIETGWDGFGANKNKGVSAARYDWIVAIDADEVPDQQLLASMAAIDFDNPNLVYMVRFKTYLGKKLIRFGEWGRDAHVRMFNRTTVLWNNAPVHEQLVIPQQVTTQSLQGFIHHYTMENLADYATKLTRYALLSGDRYHLQGKRASWAKRNLSARFSFLQNYLLKAGFLDGREGYIVAKMTAYYTFLKYQRLYELNQAEATAG